MTLPPASTRDPGLQPERTALAWRRTSLSSVGLAVLAAKALAVRASALAVVAASLLALAAVVSLVVARRHDARADVHEAGPTGSCDGAALAVVGVLVLAAAGVTEGALVVSALR